MPGPTLPTYDDVLTLPALMEGSVTSDFIDVNGHMNIRHYLDYGATSADVIIRRSEPPLANELTRWVKTTKSMAPPMSIVVASAGSRSWLWMA